MPLMVATQIIDVMDLSVSAIASFGVLFACIELRGAYPFLIYLTTSLISLLLLPNKLPALYYALFFGYYPILKLTFEKFKAPISYTAKLVCVNVSLFLIAKLSTYFISVSDELIGMSFWLFLLGSGVFILFDVALSRIAMSYRRYWKHKLNIKI